MISLFKKNKFIKLNKIYIKKIYSQKKMNIIKIYKKCLNKYEE